MAYQDLGNLAGAASAYRRALTKEPGHVEARFNLGVVLQDTGDVDGAMESYKAAYRLRPSCFGVIAIALTQPKNGRLWLDPEALRRWLAL